MTVICDSFSGISGWSVLTASLHTKPFGSFGRKNLLILPENIDRQVHEIFRFQFPGSLRFQTPHGFPASLCFLTPRVFLISSCFLAASGRNRPRKHHAQEFTFLGHIIVPGLIRMDADRREPKPGRTAFSADCRVFFAECNHIPEKVRKFLYFFPTATSPARKFRCPGSRRCCCQICVLQNSSPARNIGVPRLHSNTTQAFLIILFRSASIPGLSDFSPRTHQFQLRLSFAPSVLFQPFSSLCFSL